jgi:6-phospho-beta-glucosidase
MFFPAFSIDGKEEKYFASMHANHYQTFDIMTILKGEYPSYVVDALKEKGLTPDWTEAELTLLKDTADYNDFIGLNYYQPARVAKIDGAIESTKIDRDKSTGKPGNPSFDGVYRTVMMEDKVYTKWGWEISSEGFLDGLRMLKERYGDVNFISLKWSGRRIQS